MVSTSAAIIDVVNNMPAGLSNIILTVTLSPSLNETALVNHEISTPIWYRTVWIYSFGSIKLNSYLLSSLKILPVAKLTLFCTPILSLEKGTIISKVNTSSSSKLLSLIMLMEKFPWTSSGPKVTVVFSIMKSEP